MSFGGGSSAGAGTGTDKCAVQIFAYEISGTGVTNIGSNESIFAVRGQKGGSMQSVFIVDIEGDLHTDGSTSLPAPACCCVSLIRLPRGIK